MPVVLKKSIEDSLQVLELALVLLWYDGPIIDIHLDYSPYVLFRDNILKYITL